MNHHGGEGSSPAGDALDQCVRVLADLASAGGQEAVQALQQRVQKRRLRVLVAGEAKRGKSTLVNRLIGQDVLPTGVVPVTAIATTVRRERGATELLRVRFQNGRLTRAGIEALADLVTERANPNNVKQIASVEVLLGPGPLDQHNVELVDTPGTGSVFEHNTATARTAIEGLDAALFVLCADPPISAAERDLLKEVSARSVHTMVVLNKADLLSGDDLAQAVEFTRTVCDQVSGRPVNVFAVSARGGAADAGFADFAAEFDAYLSARADADADAALRRHASRLAASLLDEALVTARTMDAADAQLVERVRLFTARIDQLASGQGELEDRGWAAERRLRRTLGESATALGQWLSAQCRARVEAALDSMLATLPAQEMEQQGRNLAIEVIRTEVDRWRADQARALEQGLRELAQSVVAEQDRQLAELRESARELLDIRLAVEPSRERLGTEQGFWYAFARPVGWEPPLAEAVRRLAPGRVQRARTRLLEELPALVDRQVGRARADLAQRLQEGTRSVLAELRTSHSGVLGRLRGALTSAEQLRTASEAERDAERERLHDRVDRLLAVQADLATPARSPEG